MPQSQPKLRVLAGPSPSPSSLTLLHVNADSHPLHISSPSFEGDIAVRIRDFHGEAPEGKDVLERAESGYFEEHRETTWSIQVRGVFKGEGGGGEKVDADQVVFGNTFDGPIYDYLPYGTTAALQVLKQIDSSLEHDLRAEKPWALSPFLATMTTVNSSPSSSSPSSSSGWSASRPAEDITSLLPSSSSASASNLKDNPSARRRYLSDPSHRKEIRLDGEEGKETVIEAEFANGWIDFNDLSLKIGGVLSVSLAKYWNGQPVRYVCRSRDGKHDYFCVVFDIVEGVDPVGKNGKSHKAEEAEKAKETKKEVDEPSEDKDALGVD